MGQHPSDRCPLCRDTDKRDHFLKCKQLNEDREYTTLRGDMQHKGKSDGILDHMINTTAGIMSGREVNYASIPQNAAAAYEEKKQGRVG